MTLHAYTIRPIRDGRHHPCTQSPDHAAEYVIHAMAEAQRSLRQVEEGRALAYSCETDLAWMIQDLNRTADRAEALP